MNLVIVESPTKARTLGGFLPAEFKVVATMGHIRDLPENRFGVKIVKIQNPKSKIQNFEFEPQYVVMPKKKEIIEKLKSEAQKAEKIYLASVDYQELILVRFPDGLIRLVKIGPFIDEIIRKKENPAFYQVPAFDFATKKISFKPLKNLTRHPIHEELLEVTLDYGRRIKITASHSVFTKNEKGEIKLVEGRRLKEGDKLLVPLILPQLCSQITQIDLLKEIYFDSQLRRRVFINSPSVSKYRREIIFAPRFGNLPPFQQRVFLSDSLRKILITKRKENGWNQKLLAKKIGCAQSDVCKWERGRANPILPLAKKYFAYLGINLDKMFKKKEVNLLCSSLERAIRNAVDNQWRDSRKSLARTYQPLSWFSWEEIEKNFRNDNTIRISRHNHTQLLPRFIPVNRDLMLFLGFFIAEGSFFEKGKYLKFNFGKRSIGGEKENIQRVKKICLRLFRLKAGEFEERTSTSLVVKSTLVSFLLRKILGTKGKAEKKEIPWLIFNVPSSLQLAFLEGLFLGDGSLGKCYIAFNTVSPLLACGLRFLLLQNGILTSCAIASSKKPGRKPLYQVIVGGKKQLSKLKLVWERHYKAKRLKEYLKKGNYKNWSLVKDKEGDLGLLKVCSIKRIKASSQFVYDFSVDGENFICGDGGVCAHNTDPDREGEAIAWHITQILNFKFKILNLKRITFHEITRAAIEKALANPGEINLCLVDAQQARRVLDRIVGYKLSPLLWYKIRRGLSAGRVQSVAVRLIVEREREIEKFIPQEYWEVWVELRKHIGGLKQGVPTFLAKLEKINGQEAEIKNESQVKPIVEELKKANYEVLEVERREVFQQPPPPFTTSTLQQKAAQVLRFSSKKTMQIAQKLYEKGLITYHRTDSVALAAEAVGMIRDFIAKNYGKEFLPEKPRIFKTKSKVAQEAHEAIRPTALNFQFSSTNFQTKDEQRLYELIWRRAVGSQMAAAVWDQTKVEVQGTTQKNIYILEAEGKIIKFDGWMKIYDISSKFQASGFKKEGELPELRKGEDLDLIKVEPQQKFTQPPPRYTEASLIKTLEKLGIGRPSTYAPIVWTIQERQYVEKKEGKFWPTPLGITVNDFLVDYFPDIVDYDFTAKMEDSLDAIARGEKKWQPVLSEFYGPFSQKLEGVAKVAEKVKVPVEPLGEKCPKCGVGELVVRVGKFGKFVACSRFPECSYTTFYIEKVEGVKCPECGGEVVVRRGKNGKKFYGCANWPKCKWASWKKPK